MFAAIGWADYLDGFAARLTGQYSRLGALLDPIVDRLLVISGMVVVWHFELLPRWAIVVVVARELVMLVLSRLALARGIELKINWLGRLGVAPTMGAPFFAMCGLHTLALVLMYVGLVARPQRHGAVHPRWARPARGPFQKPQAEIDPSLRRLYTRPLATSTTQDWGFASDMDTFPDLGALGDQELKELIKQLTDEEMEVSYRRRILHGKIDILRAELVNRLRKKDESGELVITGADVQQLTDILSGRVPGSDGRVARGRPLWPCIARSAASPTPRAPTTASAAERSSEPPSRRPGRRLRPTAWVRPERSRRSSSVRWPLTTEQRWSSAPAAVGRGRASRSIGERLTIGRRPDSDIFLDDVTVSRDHAVLVRRGDDFFLDDCGSLNGTYVNRKRIESHRLADGDELQIGKYKLAFLQPLMTASDIRPSTLDLTADPASDERRAAAPEVGDDRRRLQGAGPGVPRHLDLQDPLPGGPEAARPAADAGRLPALHPDRHPAPADDPASPARRVPAAAGDPPGARRRPRRA